MRCVAALAITVMHEAAVCALSVDFISRDL